MSRTGSSDGSLYSNDRDGAGFRRSRPNSMRRKPDRSSGRYSTIAYEGGAASSGGRGGSFEGDDAGPPPNCSVSNLSSSPGSLSAESMEHYYSQERVATFRSSQDYCGMCKKSQMFSCNSFCLQLDTRELPNTIASARAATSTGRVKSVLHKLLMVINALMNDCGGAVVVHLSQPYSLALLDHLVDDRLAELIPDTMNYDDHFERSELDDNHVLYRVKPTPDPAISILVFPSMLAHNQGLSPPSQRQIQKLVLGCFLTPTWTEGRERERYAGDFAHSKPVKLRPSCAVRLHSLDALTVQRQQGSNFGEVVLEHWWDTLRLAKHVSALCKLQTGGSVYLGIDAERSEPAKKWKRVESCDFGMLFPGTAKKLWEDIGNHDNNNNSQQLRRSINSSTSSTSDFGNTVHHLAREEDVPRDEGRLTGRYICQGVELNRREREALKASLLRKVQNDMLWYPTYPSTEPVRVVFHPARSSAAPDNLCVVEVEVSRFHGVVFHDKRGPKAFQIMPAISGQEPQIDSLPVSELMTRVSGYPLRGYDPHVQESCA